MKKFIVLFILILAGFAQAESFPIYRQVILTHEFQIVLWQQGKLDEAGKVGEYYTPEEIPIEFKIQALQNILGDCDYEVIGGDVIHDYQILVKINSEGSIYDGQ